MRLREGLSGLRSLPPGMVVTIGNFDGVHLGHRRILETCDTLRARSSSGRVAVVTFEPHPLTALRPDEAPPRLTSVPMKRELLASLGVDELVELPPSSDVLGLTAEAFWALLRDEARVAHLVEGETFSFGKGRAGTIDKLREWSRDTEIDIHVVPPVTAIMQGQQVAPVSSSLVRFLVDGGRARDASSCLGRPYALEGTVIKGHQRGRTIGIPTANLDCGDQLIPADGVYSARCTLDGSVYPVALSIGTLPTFGDSQRQIEGFILDYSGDLYGRVLRFDVLNWIREQWKLPGIDALKVQIAKDIAIVRNDQLPSM